jgi:hypothetical protein
VGRSHVLYGAATTSMQHIMCDWGACVVLCGEHDLAWSLTCSCQQGAEQEGRVMAHDAAAARLRR